MATITRQLGEQFEVGGVQWRVIRLVKSSSVHLQDNAEILVEEEYLELKSEQGSIDFIVLLHTEEPFERPTPSTISAPAPINWRNS